jgi:hypothetical protein
MPKLRAATNINSGDEKTGVEMTNLNGKFLYSTCAGRTFGKIDSQYKDENNCDVIDVIINDINDILHFRSRSDGESEFDAHLTQADINCDSGNPTVVLKRVGYILSKTLDGHSLNIKINTPDGGCFRCSQCFLIEDDE